MFDIIDFFKSKQVNIFSPFPLGRQDSIDEQTPTLVALRSPVFDTPTEQLCQGIVFASDLSSVYINLSNCSSL